MSQSSDVTLQLLCNMGRKGPSRKRASHYLSLENLLVNQLMLVGLWRCSGEAGYGSEKDPDRAV